MNIDYDGIMLARESELNSDERRLIASMMDAMKDGEIPTVDVPTKWSICDYCDGDGGHSRRFGAISADEWHEWSEEAQESYLSGRYDERCDLCNGSGKVRIINEDALPVEVQKWIHAYREDAYDSAMERYSERMAGC
jgi:hypothetical protein